MREQGKRRAWARARPFDVLNAEQELLDARSSLISAEIAQRVSHYSLLAAMGKLTAEDLGLDVVTYDPVQYYEFANTRRGLFGGRAGRVHDIERAIEEIAE